MFSWITGSRVTNAIEELEADVGYENTIIDPPETPAHQFAVKAFKHAVFGTPAPEDTVTAKKLQKKQLPDALKAAAPEVNAPKDSSTPCSPMKHPAGIMKTPITANKSRKSVSFGAHVVDNEGRKGHVSKSGIPNDCPGKFPSPWTPGSELKAGLDSDQKLRTKLTAALFDARTVTQPKPEQKQKASDDSDVNGDLGVPLSDSGKYWKEQYESYAKQSEKEVKKLVAKQQLAKSFAKQKDEEVVELVKQLEQERKRHRRREYELEQQNKEHQERLRQSMAEKLSTGMEITTLKNRIATLEKSANIPSSGTKEEHIDISIYEDTSKEAMGSPSKVNSNQDASYLSTKSHLRLAGKENAPPKLRHGRGQALPEARAATSFIANSELGLGDGQVATLIGKSLGTRRGLQSTTKPIHAASTTETNIQLPLGVQAIESTNDGAKTGGSPLVLPSSSLPQPSPGPDLWLMNHYENEYGTNDRMGIPSANGTSYTKSFGARRQPGHRPAVKSKNERPRRAIQSENTHSANAPTEASRSENVAPASLGNEAATRDSIEPRVTGSKSASYHAKGSAQETKDETDLSQARKDRARQRLAEKKKRKVAVA